MDEHFYKALLDNLYDGVYFVDRERIITYWNRGAERITGYTLEQVMGTCCADNLLMHVDESGTRLCEAGCPLLQCLQDGEPRENEVYLHHREGHRVPVVVRIGPIRDAEGAIVGAVETFTDNSRQHRSRQELEALRQMALIDPLTGVGNRRYTQDTLDARLRERERYQWECGVIFGDIDHFKSINDRLGHDTGDRVLRMVAQTLSNAVRGFDFVGRWGGEEFVIVLTHADGGTLHTIAERCRALVEGSSVQTDEGPVTATMSLGATLARENESADAVLKRADELMYRSKGGGRNQVTIG